MKNYKDYKLNLRLSAFDPRQKYFRLPITAKIEEPKDIDLSDRFPYVFDQGNLGSCVFNAVAMDAAYMHQRLREGGFPTFSRLFAYYNYRKEQGCINQDTGADAVSAFKGMRKYGICQETLCPYLIEDFNKEPSKVAYIEALDFQVLNFYRISDNSTYMIRAALALELPVPIGVAIYKSFYDAKDGVIPMPKKGDTLYGYHEMLAVGCQKGVFTVLNSWGEGWGKNGCCFIKEDVLKKLIVEANVLKEIE